MSVAPQAGKMFTAFPWVDLVEAQADDTAAYHIAANYNGAPIAFEGEVYTGWPMKVGPDKQSTTGTTATRKVSIYNWGGAVSQLVRQGKFKGRTVKIATVNTEDLTDGRKYELVYNVEEVSVATPWVTFTLGLLNPQGVPCPNERFDRICDHLFEYGGGRCNYDRTMPDLIGGDFDPASCDGSLDGANGCRVHGDNEVANGRARQHPALWGGVDIPSEFRV